MKLHEAVYFILWNCRLQETQWKSSDSSKFFTLKTLRTKSCLSQEPSIKISASGSINLLRPQWESNQCMETTDALTSVNPKSRETMPSHRIFKFVEPATGCRLDYHCLWIWQSCLIGYRWSRGDGSCLTNRNQHTNTNITRSFQNAGVHRRQGHTMSLTNNYQLTPGGDCKARVRLCKPWRSHCNLCKSIRMSGLDLITKWQELNLAKPCVIQTTDEVNSNHAGANKQVNIL